MRYREDIRKHTQQQRRNMYAKLRGKVHGRKYGSIESLCGGDERELKRLSEPWRDFGDSGVSKYGDAVRQEAV